MKRIFLLIFTVLCAFSFARAQAVEAVGELTPVPSNIGKFSKHPPQYKHPWVGNYKVKFEAGADSIDLPGGKKGVAVTIRIMAKDLVFESIGNIPTARIKIYGRITAKDKTLDGFFEERTESTATVEELSAGVDKTITFRKVFALPAGKYQIGVIVRDQVAGTGVRVVKFQIDEAK